MEAAFKGEGARPCFKSALNGQVAALSTRQHEGSSRRIHPSMVRSTASATSRMDLRVSMLRFCSQR